MNAKELLQTYLSSIQNAEAAAALFADDGVIELPTVNARAQGPGSRILVCRHPDADVLWTIAKDNSISGFAVAQVTNGVTIGEDQIREVHHHRGAGRLCVDQLAKLPYVLTVESTADREHGGLIHRALNHQQRHDRT